MQSGRYFKQRYTVSMNPVAYDLSSLVLSRSCIHPLPLFLPQPYLKQHPLGTTQRHNQLLIILFIVWSTFCHSSTVPSFFIIFLCSGFVSILLHVYISKASTFLSSLFRRVQHMFHIIINLHLEIFAFARKPWWRSKLDSNFLKICIKLVMASLQV